MTESDFTTSAQGLGTWEVVIYQNAERVYEIKAAGEYKICLNIAEGELFATVSDLEVGRVTIICDHTYNTNSEYTGNYDSTHSLLCSVCSETLETEEHFGGVANCTIGKICEACGAVYTEPDGALHNMDIDYENGFCLSGCHQPAILVTEENYESLMLSLDYVNYYAIENAGQLIWYDKNHGGNNAVLVADIQIGTAEEPWNNWDAIEISNIFDGRNHTVTLYVVYDSYNTGVAEDRGISLLNSSGRTLRNLVLDGYIKCNSNYRVGGVSHSGYGGTFENIISYLDIDNKSTAPTGGIVGYFGNNGEGSTITNCAVYADISGIGFVGGLVGQGWAGYQYYALENCAFCGSVSGGTYNGALVGYSSTVGNASKVSITNSYYIDTLLGVGGAANPIGTDTSIAKTEEQFASGEVAWMLGEAFGQTLEGDRKDTYPVFATENNKVYYGYLFCAEETIKVYTNDSTASDEKLHADVDTDHVCDNGCGKNDLGEHTDGDDTDHLCDYGCGQIADEGCYDVDNDGDHTCDECGLENVTEHVDADGDNQHSCDECSAEWIGDHTGGTATCAAKAKCDACGKEYGDTLPHTHTAVYKTDADAHWNECECGDQINRTSHIDSDENEKCDVCEYDMPNESADHIKDGDTDEANGLGIGAVVGIAIGFVAVVGLGGFSLYWFVIKKKSWEDLIKMFKK